MDRATNRLEKARESFEKVGKTFRRVSGSDASVPGVIERIRRVHGIKCDRPGQIGCAASHVRTWKKFLRQGHKYAIILEDDIYPFQDMPTTEEEVEAFCQKERLNPNQIDMLFIRGFVYHKHRKPNKSCTGGYGLTAYLITRSGAKKCIQAVIGKVAPIDLVIVANFKAKKGVKPKQSQNIRAFVSTQDLAGVHRGPSCIRAMNTKATIDL